MSIPVPDPCTLDEPPGCCTPASVTFLEHWSHEWHGPGPDPVSCCDTTYPASMSVFSDSPTETVWHGQYNGTDECGNVLVLNYVLTLNKLTGIATAERPGVGPASKSGIYGVYSDLVAEGLCGTVTVYYEVVP